MDASEAKNLIALGRKALRAAKEDVALYKRTVAEGRAHIAEAEAEVADLVAQYRDVRVRMISGATDPDPDRTIDVMVRKKSASLIDSRMVQAIWEAHLAVAEEKVVTCANRLASRKQDLHRPGSLVEEAA